MSSLRQTRSTVRSAPLSSTKAKRKSGDREDMENRSPNMDDEATKPKKSRFFGMKADDSKKAQPTSRTRSALPRYTNTSTSDSKRRIATERMTAERSQTTPSKTKSSISPPRSTSSSSTPRTVGGTRRKARQSLSLATRGRIKSLFDKVNIQDETKINEMIAPKLKVKCKWDYKDKAKRQTEVINDLKGALRDTIQEFRAVRSDCEVAEQSMDDLISQLRVDLGDAEQLNSDLKKSESKLKRDYIRVSNDYNSCRSQLRSLEEEIAPLREDAATKSKELATLVKELEEKTQIITAAEIEVNEVKEELRALREEKSDLTKSFQDLVDEASNEYQKEIDDLKRELSKVHDDCNRVNAEKDRIKDKAEGTTESVFKLESQLREALASVERLNSDKTKLQDDLNEMKQNLALKDSDLRATLSSMQEFQRLASEEKSALRTELSSIQPRLHLLEEQRMEDKSLLASNREELSSASKEVARLRELLENAQQTIAQKDKDISSFRDAAVQLEVEREVRARAESREELERNERIAACAQLLATQSDCSNRVRDVEEKSETVIKSLREEIVTLEQQRMQDSLQQEEMAEKIAVLEGKLSQYEIALEHAEANHETVAELGQVKGELELLRRRVAEQNEQKHHEVSSAQQRIIELENQIAENDVQRRKLHNLVQELRGNVRVFARVRPFLPSDEIEGEPESTIITRHDNAGIRIVRKPQKADEKLEEHSFVFDKSFEQSSSQEAVFKEVSEFVQSALDGFNVCLFSYGQTGSGKTHTMQGSGDGPMRGIIPRAIQQVGIYKGEQEAKGWEYFMEVSFIEIYNETIRDLLRQGQNGDIKHEIKKDASGNMFVSDATRITIDPNDSVQLDEIMRLAARHRSVGHTAMNAQSSRSHSIFTLHLKARNANEGIVLKGALNLCDLAGSERLDRSGATGSRMKETLAINKSLSSLTDVFVALANKQAHIPFRNSKLTHLLQPCLSGDGKALMMVNLSPTYESYFESLCSLRFASQVNQCELGKPKRSLKEATSGQFTSNGTRSSTLMSSTQSSASSAAVGSARKAARLK